MRHATVGVVLGTAAILGAAQAAPASADHGQTIRYLSTNPTNTDVDLAGPWP
jgi:hypothetical protein